jgi:hypothetical protein
VGARREGGRRERGGRGGMGGGRRREGDAEGERVAREREEIEHARARNLMSK